MHGKAAISSSRLISIPPVRKISTGTAHPAPLNLILIILSLVLDYRVLQCLLDWLGMQVFLLQLKYGGHVMSV